MIYIYIGQHKSDVSNPGTCNFLLFWLSTTSSFPLQLLCPSFWPVKWQWNIMTHHSLKGQWEFPMTSISGCRKNWKNRALATRCCRLRGVGSYKSTLRLRRQPFTTIEWRLSLITRHKLKGCDGSVDLPLVAQATLSFGGFTHGYAFHDFYTGGVAPSVLQVS